MDKKNLHNIETFTEDSLPDLDTVVLGALEYLEGTALPDIAIGGYNKLLVVASENALVTGRILFEHCGACFHNESTYKDALLTEEGIDAVCVISASGGKHAIEAVQTAIARDLPTFLLTNAEDAPAGSLLDTTMVTLFPKMREPYTYNTSTYLSMLLAKTNESPVAIHDFIRKEVEPRIPDSFAAYDAFFMIVEPQFSVLRDMFRTKFDELFGPMVVGRAYTLDQAKHAKTVVPSTSELFVSFGTENTIFGSEHNRLHIPLPENADSAAMLAVGYYVIGRMQSQFPPYFKEHIARYVADASRIFGHTIPVIVE